VAWVRDAWNSVRRFPTGGNYLNFQTADEDDYEHRRMARVARVQEQTHRRDRTRNPAPDGP
jgi:hypothetical protein